MTNDETTSIEAKDLLEGDELFIGYGRNGLTRVFGTVTKIERRYGRTLITYRNQAGEHFTRSKFNNDIQYIR